MPVGHQLFIPFQALVARDKKLRFASSVRTRGSCSFSLTVARDCRTDTSDRYAILLRSSSWGVGAHKIRLGSALGTRRLARLGARLDSARLGSALRSTLLDLLLGTQLISAHGSGSTLGSGLSLGLSRGSALLDTGSASLVWFRARLRSSRFVF